MFLQSLAAPGRRWMPPRLRGSRLRASQSALLSTELAAVPHFSPPLSLLHVSPSLVLSSIKYVPHDRIGHLARSSASTLDNQF